MRIQLTLRDVEILDSFNRHADAALGWEMSARMIELESSSDSDLRRCGLPSIRTALSHLARIGLLEKVRTVQTRNGQHGTYRLKTVTKGE
jgi:hypothetical protein